jgi:NADH-quinone oxidoreductase subunit L
LAGFWSKDTVLASVHDKVHAIEHELEHRHAEHAPAASEHQPAESASPMLAGPLAGWSDSQLAATATVYEWLYYSALLTAFLTAFYTFRAYAMTFHGDERIPHQAGHHAHESPPVMVAPLLVLAICAALVGILCIAKVDNWGANHLVEYLSQTPSLAAGVIATTRVEPQFHEVVAGLSTVVALAGVGLALFLYMGEPTEARFLQRALDLRGVDRLTDPQWVTQLERVWWIGATTRFLRRVHLGWLVTLIGYLLGIISLVLAIPLVVANFLTPYRLSRDKFYFDELYAVLVVWPLRILAKVLYWFDRAVIDGLVDLVGRVPAAAGWIMRSLQMGLVQFYALAMVLGMLILVAARLVWAAG